MSRRLCWLDPDRFRRVLINIFDNACQAISARVGAPHVAPHTAGQLQIVSTCIDSDVYIAIRDNGVGMAPEVLANIFEPLYSTKVFGVGLGLTIVREIVRQHGGDIRVTSQPGDGSEVELCLPQSICPRVDHGVDNGCG
ncbi:hypothetical protein C2W62_07135 [Candidatus Entotheonella serta]|nr:hypothetical protein C2W62_07135 [Candidatus Entotheonella serta]